LRRVLVLSVLLVAALAAAGAWAWRDYEAPGPLATARVVVVPKSAGLFGIADALEREGVVAHGWVFVAGTLARGEGRALKAGEYEFAAALSARGVADLLASGRVFQHRLTLPEGLTSAEAAALIAAAPALEGTLASPPPEGSLLPDTYFYTRGTSRTELVARMQHAMTRALDAAWRERAPGLPFDRPEDALILASIVEKETAHADERARIAGVYVARLRLGMRLQADPSVLYALTRGGTVPLGRPLDHDDLAVESPYNTYLHKGLPPGPIANPGRSAILAALYPEKVDYLFFVAQGDGSHFFSKEYGSHTRAVNRYHANKRRAKLKTKKRAAARDDDDE